MPPVPKPKSKSKDAQGAERKGLSRNLLIALIAAAVVAAALIVGSIVLSGGDDDSSSDGGSGSSDAIALVAGIPQDDTILGDPDAPTVRMLIYEDIQCPFCKEFTVNALPGIIDQYVRTNKVKLDWRGLAFLGADSEKALRISLAAGLQDKLWEVVGLFYENQGEENSGWVTDDLVDEILAEVPGLDAAKVKEDAASEAITRQIADIQAEATASGVNGTPSFFIAAGVDKPYQIQVTALTPEAFQPALDDAIAG